MGARAHRWGALASRSRGGKGAAPSLRGGTEPTALAFWDSLPGVGRRVGVYLTFESVRVLREREAVEPCVRDPARDLRTFRWFRWVGFEVTDERAVGWWVGRAGVGALPPFTD